MLLKRDASALFASPAHWIAVLWAVGVSLQEFFGCRSMLFLHTGGDVVAVVRVAGGLQCLC